MRGYIFTDTERETIEQYLEKGIRLSGFYVILHLIKKNHASLKKDMDLLDEILEKTKP